MFDSNQMLELAAAVPGTATSARAAAGPTRSMRRPRPITTAADTAT
jgi:hypothetical protein